MFATMFSMKDKKLLENLYLFDLTEHIKKDLDQPLIPPSNVENVEEIE
jgi:hypothetical protein